MSKQPLLSQHKVTVLLVDDQPLIGETVRRMVASEADVEFHYCKDPTRAIETATRVNPTVILQDLVMPEIDGLELVKRYRAHEPTMEVPIIVLSGKEEAATKAEAFALGGNDYIVKLPDRLELLARIRHHSKGYINLLQRNEAFQALAESQRQLASDVDDAAQYVRSLLPERLDSGPIKADWRFVPSAALGGDTFSYQMLDDRHFSFYLCDVVGHGVGAALLSVSVLNAVRSQSLPHTDFTNPGQVITALNNRFQMSQQADKYFTAWYGVLDIKDRKIAYAGGGHPPALLVHGPTENKTQIARLEATGPMVGAFDGIDYPTETCELNPYAKVFLYSDGVFEVSRPDGSMWSFEAFEELMAKPSEPRVSDMDRLMAFIRDFQGGRETYHDDFSILELKF
jgi:sigma-B regulation protein RsbU (phosphoserine phosphatase)